MTLTRVVIQSQTNRLNRPIGRLKCLPKQKRFMESTAPALLYSGAWGAGKTRILCEKAYFLALLYPGNFVGLCRKTYNSLKQTTMKTFFEEVCPPDHIKKYNKSDHVVTLKNGSEIYFFGMDNYLKIGSLNLGSCGIDEAIELTEDDWIALQGRLRQKKVPFHQIFLATNPAHPGHWIYQTFYQRGEGEVVESNSLENPYLPQDYVNRIKRLSGRYYDRFVLGKWIGFEGLVYDVFDPLVHIIDKMPRGWEEWPKVRSIDFGYSNPFVCQWWAISPSNVWYLYREIYFSHRIVEEHAAQINKYSYGEHYVATYTDHDAEDRATLEKYGIDTDAAVKDITPGIQEVYSKMKVEEVDGKKRSHIYFLRDALVEEDPWLVEMKKPTCTIQEIQHYQYPRSRGEYNLKEEPLKANDHGMDAMRYAIFSWENRRAWSPPISRA